MGECNRCGEDEEMIMVNVNDKVTLYQNCYDMFEQLLEGHQQLENRENPVEALIHEEMS